MWIISKGHHEKISFCTFLQTPHQVDMKNVVECWKEFVAYFNALETHSVGLSNQEEVGTI